MLRNLNSCRNHLAFRTLSRSLKTRCTAVFSADDAATRLYLVKYIKLLDKVLNSATYNKPLLYGGKYNSVPKLIEPKDWLQLQQVIKNLLGSFQQPQTTSRDLQGLNDTVSRLGVGLLEEIFGSNVTGTSTTLILNLIEQYNKKPGKETVEGITYALEQLRKFLRTNKVFLRDIQEIDKLVDGLTSSERDAQLVREILQTLDYKLVTDDVVRLVSGRKMEDELEVSKGWKLPTGVFSSNDPYLRSLDLKNKGFLAVDQEMFVLVFDGTLRDSKDILPTLAYINKQNKPLLLVVTEDCTDDALVSITINNNKNRRQNSDAKVIILKYSAEQNNGLSIQENPDFIQFLKLPEGMVSIYSPEFSDFVPSTVSGPMFYGRLESLRATTDEALLYNPTAIGAKETDLESNPFLRTTVTVRVGGDSEQQIHTRRSLLDNIINNVLCNGLANGFIPSYGIALAKAIPFLSVLKEGEPEDEKYVSKVIGLDGLLSCLDIPMIVALSNTTGMNRTQVKTLVAETMNTDFRSAVLSSGAEPQDVTSMGWLEPWNRMDESLANVIAYLKLVLGPNTVITRVYDKPTKRKE